MMFLMLIMFVKYIMLTIVKRLIGPGYSFATVRKVTKKQKPTPQQEQTEDQEVFKAYRKQIQKGSILRQFRHDVYRRSQLAGDWDGSYKAEAEDRKLRKMMNADKDEMLAKVSHIEARATQQRNIFDENTGRSLLSDYGNYKSYDKVHPIFEDRNLAQNQYFQQSQITQNIYNFIDKLPSDYYLKQGIQQVISQFPVNQQNITVAQYGKMIQKRINDAQHQRNLMYEDYKIHQEQKYMKLAPATDEDQDVDQNWFDTSYQHHHQYTSVPDFIDPDNGGESMEATLSPQAVDTIYQLYLQGWCIRDISKRFGILPARAKFCVWVRAQLYHEVIPKLGVNYYLRALRFEEKYNKDTKYCDYGLDINELNNDTILSEINQWNGKMLDAQRKPQPYMTAMFELEKERVFDKHERVEVGTHGKENKKYRLKEWRIFRGKGSDEYFLRNKLLRQLTRDQKKFNKVYY